MTQEEREALGESLLDVNSEIRKYGAENEHYDQLAKNLTAIANAINEYDNGEKDRELKERELALKEEEIRSEKKRGWIGMIGGWIVTAISTGVTIWAFKTTTRTTEEVSKTDIPSKSLTKATDKARDSILKLPNWK